METQKSVSMHRQYIRLLWHNKNPFLSKTKLLSHMEVFLCAFMWNDNCINNLNRNQLGMYIITAKQWQITIRTDDKYVQLNVYASPPDRFTTINYFGQNTRNGMYSFTQTKPLTQLVLTNQIRYTDYWIISESLFRCYVYFIRKLQLVTMAPSYSLCIRTY